MTRLAHALFAFCAFLPAAGSAEAPGSHVKFLADWNLPPGTRSGGTVIGGLSGIAYDAGNRELLAISDDKGHRGNPRFHRFRLSLGPGKLELVHLGFTELKDTKGVRIRKKRLDPEGIALLGADTIFVASEGVGKGSPRKPRTMPEILEFSRSGRQIRSLKVPPKFLPPKEGPDDVFGVVPNGGFEGLGLSPDGKHLWAAIEKPLAQDGLSPTLTDGALIRILRYSIDGQARIPDREYAYPVDPGFKPEGAKKFAILGSGVSEILPLDSHRLLVLEKAASADSQLRARIRVRIYLARIGSETTEVSKVVSFRDQPPVPMRKELVIDLDSIVPSLNERWRSLDAIEGMAFGPRLPNGHDTLILLADDNFRPDERTQAIAFEIVEPF